LRQTSRSNESIVANHKCATPAFGALATGVVLLEAFDARIRSISALLRDQLGSSSAAE